MLIFFTSSSLEQLVYNYISIDVAYMKLAMMLLNNVGH